MAVTNPLEPDPALVGTLTAMQTLAEAAGVSMEEAVEILRTGAVEPGRTVALSVRVR